MRRILMTGVALFFLAGGLYLGFQAIRLFVEVGSGENPLQVRNGKSIAIATFCLGAGIPGLQGAYAQFRRHRLKSESGN